MNKHIWLLFLFLFVTQIVNGQEFKAGLIGGLIASDVVGINPHSTSFKKAGVTFGGIVNGKLTEKNSFQFEILYTQKGSLQRGDSANNFSYYKLNLNYIEVPFLFCHNFIFHNSKKYNDHFTIEVGPSIGSLIKIKQEGLLYSDGTYIQGTYDNRFFRRFDAALNIGFNYRIADGFSANVRFSHSLIPVIKRPEDLPSFLWYTFNKGDNMVFYFSLKYLFKIEKKEKTQN